MTRYAQLTLDGNTAKIIAIDRVERNASPGWKRAAQYCIEQAAQYRNTFTTDLIWQWLEEAAVPAPHEPRAMGAAIRDAQRRGLIRATGRYEPSRRIECHARPLMVWGSVPRAS